MLGLFHWILGETSATPRGRMTLHVSEYEVPTSPDPSPDTTTTGASTTEYPESCEIANRRFATMYSPGVTGPTTGLGRSTRATREILWIPPTGRPASSCVWSSLLSVVKATL